MSVVFYGCETWRITPTAITVLTSALTRSYCFATGGWKKKTNTQTEEEHHKETQKWRDDVRKQVKKVVQEKLRCTRNTYLRHILR